MIRTCFFVFCYLCLLPKVGDAQEIRRFYEMGGGKPLAAPFGAIGQLEAQRIPQLFYPKLSVGALHKLQLVRFDADLRAGGRLGVSVDEVSKIADGTMSTAAYAQLLLGDYYWNSSRDQANFNRAKPYYDAALREVLNSPAHLVRITERVLKTVAEPRWFKGDETVRYGSFGNFLASKQLLDTSEKLLPGELRSLVYLRAAQSSIREGKGIAEVCELLGRSLERRERGSIRAEALLVLSQQAGPDCPNAKDSNQVLRQLVAEFQGSALPEVRQAKAALEVESKGSFSVAIEPGALGKEPPQLPEVMLLGPRGKSATVTLTELGLMTEEGLKANRVELSPWLASRESIVRTFMAPMKRIQSVTTSPGPLNLLSGKSSGPYAIILENQPHHILNSELLLLLSKQRETIEIQTISLKTGAAIPDVKIEVHRRLPNGLRSVHKIERLQSDVTGLASTTKPTKGCLLTEECDSEETVILGEKYRHVALLGLNYKDIIWPFEGDPDFWLIPSNPKPAPGETVSWNLILRPDIAPRFRQSKIQVTLVHPFGPRIGQKFYDFDRFGRAAGVVSISKKFSPGTYILEVKVKSLTTDELHQIDYPLYVTQARSSR